LSYGKRSVCSQTRTCHMRHLPTSNLSNTVNEGDYDSTNSSFFLRGLSTRIAPSTTSSCISTAWPSSYNSGLCRLAPLVWHPENSTIAHIRHELRRTTFFAPLIHLPLSQCPFTPVVTQPKSLFTSAVFTAQTQWGQVRLACWLRASIGRQAYVISSGRPILSPECKN
jgi:hypothetical protein